MRYFSRGNIYLWHCHHTNLIEVQCDYMKERQQFIKESKDDDEVSLRLRLFHRAKIRFGAQVEVVEKYISDRLITPLLRKLHKEQCIPDCPWGRKGDGGFTIFTKFSKLKGRWVTKTGR